MSDTPPPDQSKGLTAEERRQIGYLLRFLAVVLTGVLLASLFAGVLISIFQNG